jgi:hypothetical protein
MTDVTGDLAIPDPDARAALNAALLATGTETGFWDDQGRPATWSDDIDRWRPEALTANPAGSPPEQLNR